MFISPTTETEELVNVFHTSSNNADEVAEYNGKTSWSEDICVFLRGKEKSENTDFMYCLNAPCLFM